MGAWWDHLNCGVFIISVAPTSTDKYSWQICHANQELNRLIANREAEFYHQLHHQIATCWSEQRAVTHRLQWGKADLHIKLSPDIEKKEIIGSCYAVYPASENGTNSGQSKRRFSDLVSDFTDAVVIVDGQGYVVYVNPAAEQLFNRKAEELEGELFGLPIVVGEKTDVDIIRKGGQTTSAEMRVKETVGSDQTVYVIASLHEITERKKVEESLRIRERAIAASSNGIVITDALQPDNPIIYVNPAFERITGYKAEEVIGRNCRFLQRHDTQQPQLEILRSALKEGRECHVVLSNYRKDGQQFWNDLYVAPVFNERGELSNFVGVQTDITQQIEAERELRASEERLRTILLSMKQGVTFSDRRGYFQIFNPQMEELTGYSKAEANACGDFMRLLYPDYKDYQQGMQRLHELEYRRFISVESRIRRKNGEFRDVEVSSLLIQYAGQDMYLSVYYDVTERKKAEAKLRQQNELQRLLQNITLKIQREINIDQILHVAVTESRILLNADRVGIYKFDADWNGEFIVESVRTPELSILQRAINDSCFRDHYLEKYRQGHISSIDDVAHSTQIADCHRELLQQFDVQANVVSPIVCKSKLWGLLIAHQCSAPRQWQDFEIEMLGQISNHVAIALQQAEMNQYLEAQVRERTQQLENSLAELERALMREKELGELKSRFISMTSHEFRTPLATIQAASDLLKKYGDKMTPEKRRERLDKIQQEVKKMTELLEEVLTIGKASAGKLTKQPVPLDVNQLVRECLEGVNHLVSAKHTLVVENHWQSIEEFWADPHLLQQAVTNLLSNALKYSPQGGRITLTVGGNGQELTIAIADQGIGIPEAELPHIFESFYRANNVGNISGTGLGLAIAQAAVEQHSGRIEVHSVEGEGTTFTIHIPNQRQCP
jgi:PAS domain S-box-containing protein